MSAPAIRRALWLLAVVLIPAVARPDDPSSKQEIVQALDDVQKKYGADAVRMQTRLLESSIEGGAVLETSSGIAGYEEHEGKRYLRFDVMTGIVYDETAVKEAERAARIWVDVVDPALKRFTELELPADGVAIHLQFHHLAYRDRTELFRKHSEQPAPSEEMHVRLSNGEIVEFANARLTTNDLLDHSSLLLNGRPSRIDLTGIVPLERPPTPSAPLFPPAEP